MFTWNFFDVKLTRLTDRILRTNMQNVNVSEIN